MKRVIKGQELIEVMEEGINLLCETVGSTLGPSGNNIIINDDEMNPYIVNDGVTIANSITSDDVRINTILELAKEASFRTNELVGDGTTTTLVLLKAIFDLGIAKIKAGYNPILLKKELNKSVEKALTIIDELRISPQKKDYLSIATTSVEDERIGHLLADAYSLVKNKNAIKFEESSNNNSYFKIKKGYSFENEFLPNAYFNDKDVIELTDVYILLINDSLNDLEAISDIINEGLNRNKNIVIIASEIEEIVYQEALLYYLNYHKNIIFIKLPDYGSKKDYLFKDISFISNSQIKNNFNNITWNDLGFIKRIIINKNEIIIISDKKTSLYVKELAKELKNNLDTYEKEIIDNRIAKLKTGILTIYVGSSTSLERKEIIMRMEDAINALDISSEGFVYGEGISLLKASALMTIETAGDEIISKAFFIPFQKIVQNNGEDYESIQKEIINNSYNIYYNLSSNTYEQIDKCTILDPILIVKTALKNAVSIASILLSTKYLVINERINKENVIL